MEKFNKGLGGVILIVAVFLILIGGGIYALKKTGKDGVAPSGKGTGEKPWITVTPNKRYFMFEDGRSFFPIGSAAAGEQAQTDFWGRVQYKEDTFPFYEIDVTLDPDGLEKRFAEMKKNGENVFRIDTDGWTFSRHSGFVQYLIDSKKALFMENPAGVFDEEYTKRIDRFLALAGKYDIYINFVISPDTVQLNHFPEKHPYYKKNGGFMENRNDMFTSELARETYKNRIKYAVDHWGSSPNVFVWELFNELDWWEEKGDAGIAAEKAAWVEEMGNFLRDYEKQKYGKNHPVIVSSAIYNDPNDYFFNSKAMDAAVTHYYFPEAQLPDPYLNAKRIKEMTREIMEKRLNYSRPFWENERLAGKCAVSKDVELAISLAEVASGAAGSGLLWAHTERYLPESKTEYDLNVENRISYFQKNNTSMRSSIVAPVNRMVSKIISNAGINWANFNSRNINNQISVNDSAVEAMAVGDGTTVFGFLVKDQKQDYLIDFIRSTIDYPDGCDGGIGGVFNGAKSFIVFYGKNGVKVDLEPFAARVAESVVKYFSVSEPRARELVDEVLASPQDLKRNISKLPRDFIYQLGMDVSVYLNGVEAENQLLEKAYKGYPEASAEITVKNLSAGHHSVDWIDPETGDVILSQSAEGETVKLKTPQFGKFLVFVIKK